MPKILFFPYFGPNRRSDLRVVEVMLDFDPNETEINPQEIDDVRQSLLAAGIESNETNFPGVATNEDRHSRFAQLLAQTALLLQRKNGHRVSYFSVIHEKGKNRYIVLVEHEQSEVGMAAVKLAVDVVTGKTDSLAHDYRLFTQYAFDRLLTADADVIIKLANQRRIPVLQAEREPLKGRFNTGVRVRPNGLLILGQAKNCHVLDGTFCVDKAGDELKALLRNPGQRLALLKSLGIPSVETEKHTGSSGKLFHLLRVRETVFALEQAANGDLLTVDQLHESVIDMCQALHSRVACAAISVSLNASSLSMPLLQSGAKVLDFNPAPEFSYFLAGCEGGNSLMEAAAGELLDWLFPDPEAIRIPVIAITGTNGKTTTSRMISHIQQISGRKPGMVCTDGIFLNGRQVSDTDAATILGHARVLTSPQVDAAVLETHHRGIAVRGFAFYDCDIAICLNVTEEHLKEGEIETLEEMTLIKRALLERASRTAVLFADDARCLTMISHLNAAKICLVSLQSGPPQFAGLVSPERACFCVLETIENESWIILYDALRRIPVMPVNQIPATFDGAARFNLSNAMHALAACYFTGTPIDAIRSALSGFYASEKLTPGRMNEFEGLPFRVLIDFAHNPDGMKNVCDFADRTQVAGRKLIGFAGSNNRTDEANAKMAKAAVGHFDFYFCKDYQHYSDKPRKFLGPFIQQVLIAEGVPEEQTTVTTFGKEAIYGILDACKPGDMLILLLGHVEKGTVPDYVREYASQRPGKHPV